MLEKQQRTKVSALTGAFHSGQKSRDRDKINKSSRDNDNTGKMTARERDKISHRLVRDGLPEKASVFHHVEVCRQLCKEKQRKWGKSWRERWSQNVSVYVCFRQTHNVCMLM